MSSDAAPAAASSRHPTLQLLGGAALLDADSGAILLGAGKPLALLVYLSITPGRRTSREFLLELLWADFDPERARRVLRQTLFQLRRLLGEGALSGNEELELFLPIESDRRQFLAALEQGDLDTAHSRYRGPFLPSFGVPGGAAFERWADLERDRLKAAFLHSAELLVRRLINRASLREAIRVARSTRDRVPESEAAWRLVLEAAVAARDFVAASVEAQALEQWAAAEDIALEQMTHALITRARGLTPGPDAQPEEAGLVAELTGRAREFAAVTGAWSACKGGSARHLHLSAPAGLGKSRLLREAVARLAAEGAPVVRVQGMAGDRDVPFAFAADLAAALSSLPGASGVAPASAAALVALNPALSARYPTAGGDSSQGEELLRRRIHALSDLVHAVADEQPFALAIDDLHWIDRSSFRDL